MLNNFYWVIENELAGMALPTASRAYAYLENADQAAQEEMQRETQDLKDRSIGAVVSLTEYPIAEKSFTDADVHYLHIPVPDMTAPTQSQIKEFVAFAQQNNQDKRAVVVHCLGGMGRTGTMAACYLVSKGYASNNAIKTVRQCRPGAIETRWQEESIIEYEMLLKNPASDIGDGLL